ncbi:DNA phosphorothioation-associated putative methyltransferase [Acidicapsa dinghuensis]|uniref:DNA phosphorothioation-associated putative methyltransferase n=1 Tax=Acidicapsa dinghuensis TaxID=2218256 RepID=A0ABW1EL97_9BACT|nr:DNA phosphorothioation-associated putative methyltransferase [Acidicapsa dinghuensis]
MIARDRTAIRRNDLSRPIRTALSDGIISADIDLLDYGCGHGDDIRYLEQAGINAFGWDPAHRPDGPRRRASIVNLGYVVNVIEDAAERADCVRSAWNFTGGKLILAARLKSDLVLKDFEILDDGYVTRLQTFQKFFEQQELREWIQEVLGETPVAAAPGIFYIFRDPNEREQFVASRYRSQITAPRIRISDKLFEGHQTQLQELISFVTERGRLPEQQEIGTGQELISIFGSMPRAFQIIRRVTGREQWEQIAKERRTDLLVYLALGRFPRRPKFSALPRDLQNDIRSFFKSYKAAASAGDALLFEAGNMKRVNCACAEAEFGKLMPSALYVHVTGMNKLTPVLRVYEGCARVLSGEVAGTTIVKLRRDEPKISYLGYPTFDIDAHPSIEFSVRIDLRSFNIKNRQFKDSSNPPVLHRKELFVPSDYPNRALFEALTEAEISHGLLDDSNTIGLKEQWNESVRRKGWKLIGHELIPINRIEPQST